MTIHFLQQIDPPVLPYLQDGTKFDIGDRILIEGFEVQFARPSEQYAKEFCKNPMTLGELFVRFFEYFDKFNWKEHVVQIRSAKKTSKMDKGWARSSMAIEDPFELTHNLSGGVRETSLLLLL